MFMTKINIYYSESASIDMVKISDTFEYNIIIINNYNKTSFYKTVTPQRDEKDDECSTTLKLYFYRNNYVVYTDFIYFDLEEYKDEHNYYLDFDGNNYIFVNNTIPVLKESI